MHCSHRSQRRGLAALVQNAGADAASNATCRAAAHNLESLLLLSPAELQAVLKAAVSAPSADNHHAWKLRVEGDRLSLRTARLAQEGSTRRQLSRISLGAVAECMVIAASRHHIQLELSEQLESLECPVILTATRVRELQADPLAAALSERHSNRRLLYRAPNIAPDAWQQILQQAQRVPGCFVQSLDDPSRRREAVRLIERAERERFSNPALHADMYGSVRFDAGWQASTSEGLPPSVLGVAAFERAGFRLMANWRLQRLANLFGAHRLLGFRSAGLPARQAPHLIALGSECAPELGAFRAGRALLRLWCQATLAGLSAQVWAASPMYALPGASDIAEPLQRLLAAGWSSLCPQGRPMLVMRLGLAAPPSARTGRPDPLQFLA